MSSESRNLTVVFLPHFTTSHILPLVSLARQFAARGVNAIIITTPCNAALFQITIDQDNATNRRPITVHTLKFPSAEVGLPEGIENLGAATSPDVSSKIDQAIALLQAPMSQLIRDLRPDCIVSDMYLPWTVDLADELRIPRLLFYTSCFFYHCVFHVLKTHSPHEKVKSDNQLFTIPNLPDEISMMRSQLPDHFKMNSADKELVDSIKSSEVRSYGVIHDSFYEIEPSYIDYMRKMIRRRAWHVGPVSLSSNKHKKLDFQGNSEVQIWLDSQKPDSVLYVCFGSRVAFSDEQLMQISMALESSDHPFVLVVRKSGKEWMPEGFEERTATSGKGKLIQGWSPQVAILNHPATGGYMTDCGWITVMESIAAGVPLVTWPLFAEHFFNEVLITQVLKIGFGVGSEVWNAGTEIKGPVVGKDKIEKGVRDLMGTSERTVEMRKRVKELGEMAGRAVEEGGSSNNDLTAMIEELKTCSSSKSQN